MNYSYDCEYPVKFKEWDRPFPIASYKIALNREIHSNIAENLPQMMEWIMPEFLTVDGLNHGPNYLDHLVHCLLTNDDWDTTRLEQWIADRVYEGVPLSVYNVDTLLFDLIKGWLPEQAQCRLAATSKLFRDYFKNPTQFDHAYKQWCSLHSQFNPDNLKENLLKFIQPADILRLIVKDVRTLSASNCIDILDLFNGEQPNRYNLWLQKIPFAATLYISEFFTKQDYWNCMFVSFDWLNMFGHQIILSRARPFHVIKFDHKTMSKWNYHSSSWHCYQAATRLHWVVDADTYTKYRPYHVPLFNGVQLRYVKGTVFHVNLARADISSIKYVLFLPLAWGCKHIVGNRFDFYDKTWYAFSFYLRLEKYRLDYFHVRGNYVTGYDLYIPTDGLIFEKGILDVQSASSIIMHKDTSPAKILYWQTRFIFALGDDFDISPENPAACGTDLILQDCQKIGCWLLWVSMPLYIKNVTYIGQYSILTQEDANGLRGLTCLHYPLQDCAPSTLHELTIIFYDSCNESYDGLNFNGLIDTGLDKLWPKLYRRWCQIRRSDWSKVILGLSMAQRAPAHLFVEINDYREYLVNLLKYDSPSAMVWDRVNFRNLFQGKQVDATQPISALWQKIITSWCSNGAASQFQLNAVSW